MNKKTILNILMAVFVIIFAVSLGMIIYEYYQAEKSTEEFEELVELVEDEVLADTKTDDLPPPEQTPTEVEPTKQPSSSQITRNIEKLAEKNPDCVGWLCIDGTKINYPVMHTPSDPEKYLRKNFYGNYRKSGTPFIDYRCTLESDNIIIYGHNMLNGTMFSPLEKYLDAAFSESHSLIEFETLGGCEYYEVTDVRVVQQGDLWYGMIDTDDGAKYLTLSTCYGPDQQQRLIIIATKK